MISIYLYNFKNQRETNAQENKSTASKFCTQYFNYTMFRDILKININK